jgi:heme/copper-type cytochrome/quinol oxidase subunit 2
VIAALVLPVFYVALAVGCGVKAGLFYLDDLGYEPLGWTDWFMAVVVMMIVALLMPVFALGFVCYWILRRAHNREKARS